jgi:hypothetical protein
MIPRDANAHPLKLGDIVVSNEPGSTWRRTVKAIKDNGPLDGSIQVTGAIAWESPRNFICEKCFNLMRKPS